MKDIPVLFAKLLIGTKLLGLFVIILKFLQPQLHATNTNSIRIFA